MTVENPNVRNTYGGNGSTTVFPFTFALNSEDVNNVEVVLTDTEGREARTTDFALSISDKTVRYPKNAGAIPLPRGWKITLKRAVPYTQPLNLTSQGPFFAEDIEAQFDRQEMQIQQLAEVAERSVTVGFGADMTPEQFKQKFFDASKSAVTAANEARSKASEAAQSEKNASDSKNSAAAFASAADQSARSAGDSKASAARSASSSAQSSAASEASRQASAESESKIKNMQVDVHAMQQHVDEVKTVIDGVAARAKADGQNASDAAVQAQRSAVVSAQSAVTSEASAKRAEAAAKFEGVIKSENLSEKSVHKQHLSFEVYDKAEVDGRVNAKVNKSGDTMTGTLNFVHNGSHITGRINDSDYYRITGIATSKNNGYLEIAVADDIAEGIVVRQYDNIGGYHYGDFSKPAREAWLLNSDGNTSFPQAVTANTFYANDWFRARGNSGFYFQDHGGGWYMSDNDWIRVHGNKNIYTGGKIKADSGFEGALHGRADSAGNSDTLGGQSLQWIINQINAAKTGIVAGNLAQNGWVKFANGLIVQWGSIRNYEYNMFPVAYTQWVHVFLVAGMSNKTPEDRTTTYGATLVGEPTLTKFYPLVGNTEYEGAITIKTGIGQWMSIGV